MGGCPHPDLNGPRLENQIKQLIRSLLSLEPEDFYKGIANQETRQGTRESLLQEFKSLEVKLKRNLNAETELENRNLMGQEHPEVYRRLKMRYQAERSWIEERTQAINEEMVQLDREAEAVGTLQNIRERYYARIDELTDNEWRELFILSCNRVTRQASVQHS